MSNHKTIFEILSNIEESNEITFVLTSGQSITGKIKKVNGADCYLANPVYNKEKQGKEAVVFYDSVSLIIFL